MIKLLRAWLLEDDTGHTDYFRVLMFGCNVPSNAISRGCGAARGGGGGGALAPSSASGSKSALFPTLVLLKYPGGFGSGREVADLVATGFNAVSVRPKLNRSSENQSLF